MPSKISGNDLAWKKAEVETADNQSLFLQPDLQTLLAAGQALTGRLPFSKLEVVAVTYPATLVITLLDGRSWDQTIDQKVPDPPMHFTTPASWRQSELDVIRPMRDACLVIMLNHGVVRIKLEPVIL